MSAIHRVLFPVDLSLSVRSLSPTARQLFDRPDVEIVMLHALEEPPRTGRGTEVVRAMAQMEFLAHKEFRHARISLRAERGRAADCILGYAQSDPVDVIVMPTGGLESLRRNSPGHVTEEVLEHAPCGVWVEWMGGSVESSNLVCCVVGLDDGDEAVLIRTKEIVRELGARLALIHASSFTPPMSLWWEPDVVDRDLHLARLGVDELRQRFAPAARMHVEAGHPETVVSRVLHQLNASLLVVNGTTPDIFAASMACPVLRLSKTPVLEMAGASRRQNVTVLTRSA
jgi:nucleotide-binding universal stress UspA family protein